MSNSSTTIFWQKFAEVSSSPPSFTHNQFIENLFLGIPSDFKLRSSIWLSILKHHPKSQITIPYSQLIKQECEKNLLAQIDLYFIPEAVTCDNPNYNFSTVKMSSIYNILKAHVNLNNSIYNIIGCSRLIALLLLIMNGNEDNAFIVFEVLANVLGLFIQNDYEKLKIDCLVLAGLLAEFLPNLCKTFKKYHFDVIDLVEILKAWTDSFFIEHLPIDIALRLIDIIFIESPDTFISFFASFFQISQKELLSDLTSNIDEGSKELYYRLSNLPLKITNQDYDKIFQNAHSLHNRIGSKINRIRETKDWSKTVLLPGSIRFHKMIGSAAYIEAHLKMYNDHKHKVESLKKPPASSTPVHKRTCSTVHARRGTIEFEQVDLSTDMISQQPPSLNLPTQPSNNIPELAESDSSKLQDISERLTEAKQIILETDHIKKSFQLHMQQLALKKDRIKHLRQVIDRHVSKHKTFKSPSISKLCEDLEKFQIAKGANKISSTQNNAKLVDISSLHNVLKCPCIYYEGYLTLFISSVGFFGGIKSSYSKFWFVLKAPYLLYYKTPNLSTPLKTQAIDLRGVSIDTLDNHVGGENAFLIKSHPESLTLFADTRESRDTWVELLCLSSATK